MEHMTLAEAIRRGAAMGEQVYNELIKQAFDSQTHEVSYNTCAIGAAAIGRGYHKYLSTADLDDLAGMDIRVTRYLYAEYPELTDTLAQCPLCPRESPLRTVITHLNDIHGLTREAIADWLDSITLDIAPVSILQEVSA